MKPDAWIDDFARAYHNVFSGVVPGKWSSLNGLAAYAAYQGVFLDRIYELMLALREKGISPEEAAALIDNPSTFRWACASLAQEYRAMSDKGPWRAKARAVFDWMNELLSLRMQKDPWAMRENVMHTPEEVGSMLATVPWIEGDIEAVRDAGKLYVSAASLAFALYRDFFPQHAHEIFGPYDASARFGEDASLIVKYFPDIRPTGLWSDVKDFPYEEIRIYQVLKGVHFNCELIGMHSLYDGPVVPNTVAIAVEADGKFVPKEDIRKIADDIALRVTEYSHWYEKLDIPAAKRLFAEWGCYQYHHLFEAAGLDWHPTPEIYERLEKADIGMGVTLEWFPDLDQFMTDPGYEIAPLRDLYR